MRLLCNIINTDLDTAAPCWCEKLFFDTDPKFSGLFSQQQIHLSSIKMSTHCAPLPPAIVEKFLIVHMENARCVRDCRFLPHALICPFLVWRGFLSERYRSSVWVFSFLSFQEVTRLSWLTLGLPSIHQTMAWCVMALERHKDH